MGKNDARIWTAVVDAIFVTISLMAGFFLVPEYADLILKVVAVWQAPVAIIIAAITVESIEEKRAERAAIERETMRLKYGREM